MPNLIRQHNLIDNNKRALIKYVIVSDGTNEANTRLVDVSMLRFSLNTNGYIMTGNTNSRSNYRTTIKRIFGNAITDGYVRLQWEGTTNSEIVVFGSGGFDYDFQSTSGDVAVFTNPEASPTGDVLISTKGLNANSAMTFFIDIRKDSRDYDAGQTADPVAFNRGSAAP